MKKKLAVLFSMIILSATLYGEIELGLSYTPGSVLKTDEAAGLDDAYGIEQGAMGDMILGFHFGYSFWWLFYASVDSLIVPPWWVESYSEIYAPGFMNFIDVGIRPSIGPIYLLATMGINNLYIHSYYADENSETAVGVNMRVGLGIKFEALSINLIGTALFSDFAEMNTLLTEVSDGNDPTAEDRLLEKLMPSIGFVLHLK